MEHRASSPYLKAVQTEQEKASILLVDDEPILLRLGKRFFSRLGYRVLTAPSGQAALEIMSKCKGNVDILMTDIFMPGIDGIELSSILVSRYPSLKVIYASGCDLDLLENGEATLGDCVFFKKPYDFNKVASSIDRLMAMNARSDRLPQNGGF